MNARNFLTFVIAAVIYSGRQIKQRDPTDLGVDDAIKDARRFCDEANRVGIAPTDDDFSG